MPDGHLEKPAGCFFSVQMVFGVMSPGKEAVAVMSLGGKKLSQCFKGFFPGPVYSVLSGKRLSWEHLCF